MLTAFCACSLVAYSTILVHVSKTIASHISGKKHSPASLQCPDNQAQPVNPTVHARKPENHEKSGSRKGTSHSTHWRPPSTFHSEEVTHRQREPLQLQSTTTHHRSAFHRSQRQPPPPRSWLTLSHKILEVMPLDIVGKVADIDSAVLLGGIANGLHHVLFGDRSIFGCSARRVTTSTVRRSRRSSSTRCTQRRPRTAFTTVIVTAARATARGVGATATPRTARRTTTGR